LSDGARTRCMVCALGLREWGLGRGDVGITG